jgi:pyrimidine operon attenuation protein/uracil phosphoribosyltransferase
MNDSLTEMVVAVASEHVVLPVVERFPVKADFKGISLSTSSKEHVHVVFENNNNYAYLV